MRKDQDQFLLRFPEGMRARIQRQAEANKRSLTAEIVYRLEQGFCDQANKDVASLLRMALAKLEN